MKNVYFLGFATAEQIAAAIEPHMPCHVLTHEAFVIDSFEDGVHLAGSSYGLINSLQDLVGNDPHHMIVFCMDVDQDEFTMVKEAVRLKIPITLIASEINPKELSHLEESTKWD